MKCQDRTTLKLKSNVITKRQADRSIGLYIPFEYKNNIYRDVRMFNQLTSKQKEEQVKEFFYAKEIISDDLRYPNKKENEDLCKGCKYYEICH